jgi:ketopantoate hydroxymethyltransferase
MRLSSSRRWAVAPAAPLQVLSVKGANRQSRALAAFTPNALPVCAEFGLIPDRFSARACYGLLGRQTHPQRRQESMNQVSRTSGAQSFWIRLWVMG